MTIGAVGDVSFQAVEVRAPAAVFGNTLTLLQQADVIVANLESSLLEGGDPIPGKCTLRGRPEWAYVLRDGGVTLVSLANNHVMDFGPAGLASTIRALDDAGVKWVGAGQTFAEAAAPVTMSIRGCRVAFLARTSVVVSAPMYKAGNTPGVAFLDEAEACGAIKRARAEADHVVLLVHWGLEEYRYPSPEQRRLARRLVEAGADIIIGHHPHVTQGLERIGSSVVAYSLGNFLFNDFEWEYRSAEGKKARALARLSRENREGAILNLACEPDGRIVARVDHTWIEPGGSVRLQNTTERESEVEKLSRALAHRGYDWWWQTYAGRREWALRLGHVASPSRVLRNLHKARPKHVWMLLQALRRSASVVVQRSTNPYE